jgi:hypothetical protein
LRRLRAPRHDAGVPTTSLPAHRASWTIPLAAGPVAPWLDRTLASAVVVVATVVAVALAKLEPDARGHGTHEQLGWTPCSWPVWYDVPCPTCGCTTAACLVVHGRLGAAFAAQPFGALLAIAGLAAGVHALACLLRGRSFVDLLVRLPFWRLVAGGVLSLLAGWAYTWLTWTSR